MTTPAPPSPPQGITPLSYEQAGVNYDLIDPLKVSAQRAAASLGCLIARKAARAGASSEGKGRACSSFASV